MDGNVSLKMKIKNKDPVPLKSCLNCILSFMSIYSYYLNRYVQSISLATSLVLQSQIKGLLTYMTHISNLRFTWGSKRVKLTQRHRITGNKCPIVSCFLNSRTFGKGGENMAYHISQAYHKSELLIT